ncbi:MAG: hypothetical protein JNL01_16835 [Bdellovibrionales bacterium]|nr:hypothetical protein [Bdellovibrionales bacterium]
MRPVFLMVIFSTLVISSSSCRSRGDGDSEEAALPACTDSDLFSVQPVPTSAISYLAPIGTLAPVGGSPLPKAHTGFMLNSSNVPVTAPGNLIIKSVREVTYVTSPTRPGYTDYAVYFDVCREVGGHLGHLSSLDPAISSQLGTLTCSEYSTVDETVRNCEVRVNISVSAGSTLGTTGTPPHSPAMDIGMRDSRVSDYVNPSRYGNPSSGTLCPWSWFSEPIRSQLESKIGDGATFTTESPKCGTMQVDLTGTARGRWTLESSPANGTDPTASDFFVLARDPYAGETKAVISTRIAALNPSALVKFTLQTTGKLNAAPENISADGSIYCYDSNLGTSTYSFLVQLISEGRLRVEKKTHAAGTSVCNSAPSAWAFSGAAVYLIR